MPFTLLGQAEVEGDKEVTSFLTVIARPAVQNITEKPLFGKPYVRIGRLFFALGSWVFQQGGLLGYALRDKPILLGKLAAPPDITNINETEIVEYFKGLFDVVASQLAEAENEDKTFFYLYTVRELRKIGIDLIQWPADKNLEKKADVEFVGYVMRISFLEGIALGFNFPEQFSIYWDNTYRMRADSEWEEMRNRGIVLSEMQEKQTLKIAIVDVAENAILWSKNQAPNILDVNDIEILEALIEANRQE